MSTPRGHQLTPRVLFLLFPEDQGPGPPCHPTDRIIVLISARGAVAVVAELKMSLMQYLFAMLCRRVLWLYESLIVSLHGTFAKGGGGGGGGGGEGADVIPREWPCALARAIEEYLFLASLLPAAHHHIKLDKDKATPLRKAAPSSPARVLDEAAALELEASEGRKRARIFSRFVPVVLSHQEQQEKEKEKEKDNENRKCGVS